VIRITAALQTRLGGYDRLFPLGTPDGATPPNNGGGVGVVAAAAVVADAVKLALVLGRVLFAPAEDGVVAAEASDWQNR